jgi:hypothetical protein
MDPTGPLGATQQSPEDSGDSELTYHTAVGDVSKLREGQIIDVLADESHGAISQQKLSTTRVFAAKHPRIRLLQGIVLVWSIDTPVRGIGSSCRRSHCSATSAGEIAMSTGVQSLQAPRTIVW